MKYIVKSIYKLVILIFILYKDVMIIHIEAFIAFKRAFCNQKLSEILKKIIVLYKYNF